MLKKQFKSLSALTLAIFLLLSGLSGSIAKAENKPDEKPSTGTLIEITPSTDIENLPNIEVDSDEFNYLKEKQSQMPKTRNTFPNLANVRVMNIYTYTLRVQLQNIAIDTLDIAKITPTFYKNGIKWLAPETVVERNILPLFWRTNDWYCMGYTTAIIEAYVQDGKTPGASKVFHFTR